MSGSATDARPAPSAANSSYRRRRIDVFLTLRSDAANTPGPGHGGETITVSGLRVSAQIEKVGGNSQGALALRIYGLTQSTMNKFTVVAAVPGGLGAGNIVTVMAGDDLHGMSVVYQGTISSAWGDYASQPDVAFCITAFSAMMAAVKPVPPTSYKGGADVANIMAKLAKDMGFKFENGGVRGLTLANPYFPGTAYEQAERCAEHAGIHMTVDDGTLAIWPEGGSRGGSVPLISAETGMVGYPVRTLNGVDVKTLFIPGIRFGAKVEVQSSLQPCCGVWQVGTMIHELESEVPGGSWFTTMSLFSLGFIAEPTDN